MVISFESSHICCPGAANQSRKQPLALVFNTSGKLCVKGFFLVIGANSSRNSAVNISSVSLHSETQVSYPPSQKNLSIR